MLTLNNESNVPLYYTGNRDNNLEIYYALLETSPVTGLSAEEEDYFLQPFSLDGIFETEVASSDEKILVTFMDPVEMGATPNPNPTPSAVPQGVSLNDIFAKPTGINDIVSLMQQSFVPQADIGSIQIGNLFDLTNTISAPNPDSNISPTGEQSGTIQVLEGADGIVGDVAGSNSWFYASVNALAQTAEGQEKIAQSVVMNLDGTYDITFASDPDYKFTITPEEIIEARKTKAVIGGDIDMQILKLAYDKLQASRMEERGIPGIHIWEALSGKQIEAHDKLGREEAEDFLKNVTGGEGFTEGFGISLGGGLTPDGSATYYNSTEEGHKTGGMFTLTSIDWDAGVVTYENTSNTKRARTMSLDELYSMLEQGGGLTALTDKPSDIW